MIKKVVDEAISPTVVANENGITPAVLRGWIKESGRDLPKKYKVTGQQKTGPKPEHLQQQQPQQQGVMQQQTSPQVM